MNSASDNTASPFSMCFLFPSSALLVLSSLQQLLQALNWMRAVRKERGPWRPAEVLYEMLMLWNCYHGFHVFLSSRVTVCVCCRSAGGHAGAAAGRGAAAAGPARLLPALPARQPARLPQPLLHHGQDVL